MFSCGKKSVEAHRPASPTSLPTTPRSPLSRLSVNGETPISPLVAKAEYAVRGAVPQRAEEIKRQLKADPTSFPFDEVIACNIGNPIAVGMKPLTFHRQVLALISCPALLDNKAVCAAVHPEAVSWAHAYFAEGCAVGTGAYTHSQGYEWIRQKVARYIEARDGPAAGPCDPASLYLLDGASAGIKTLLQTIVTSTQDGIMIPIPQYPLYSAAIALLGAHQVDYYLDEANAWAISGEHLKAQYDAATAAGICVRAMVVINPGNPTGAVLTEESIREVVQFCAERNLVLLADEVYQTNIYNTAKPFVSFRKIAAALTAEAGEERCIVQLANFHSASKGFFGECGTRGGYMELLGFAPEVIAQIYKLTSISLCPNTTGQIVTGLMIDPPTGDSPAAAEYAAERDAILGALRRRGEMSTKLFSELPAMRCQPVEGAMYAFPGVTMPAKALEAAKTRGIKPDLMYALDLLEETGVVVVPGSGFGMEPKDGATWHFRTTILPSDEKFERYVALFSAFHKAWLLRWE
jgi:alanine transaminase